jgi:hypothetical protein
MCMALSYAPRPCQAMPSIEALFHKPATCLLLVRDSNMRAIPDRTGNLPEGFVSCLDV